MLHMTSDASHQDRSCESIPSPALKKELGADCGVGGRAIQLCTTGCIAREHGETSQGKPSQRIILLTRLHLLIFTPVE